MSSGNLSATPVIRDVSSKGLSAISKEIASFEENLFGSDNSSILANKDIIAVGTFSIHNLGINDIYQSIIFDFLWVCTGIFGVKSAAPIVLTPQACALSLGAIIDTVIPKEGAANEQGENWQVAPVMVATLSCDHRVVDGAVGAKWLAAFKTLVENPRSMLL
jgi:pyruvate dehydrogenase E2 component (dihydrolipoamide acetyltransferase)